MGPGRGGPDGLAGDPDQWAWAGGPTGGGRPFNPLLGRTAGSGPAVLGVLTPPHTSRFSSTDREPYDKMTALSIEPQSQDSAGPSVSRESLDLSGLSAPVADELESSSPHSGITWSPYRVTPVRSEEESPKRGLGVFRPGWTRTPLDPSPSMTAARASTPAAANERSRRYEHPEPAGRARASDASAGLDAVKRLVSEGHKLHIVPQNLYEF